MKELIGYEKYISNIQKEKEIITFECLRDKIKYFAESGVEITEESKEIEDLVRVILSKLNDSNCCEKIKELCLYTTQLISADWIDDYIFDQLLDTVEKYGNSKYEKSSRIRVIAKATLHIMG
jgi:hypothetical protein